MSHLICVVALSLVGQAADAVFIGVFKGVAHRQVRNGFALQRGANRFEAFCETTGPGRILSASVTLPGSSVVPMVDTGDTWELKAGYVTQAALNNTFPDGTYSLDLVGQSDGTRRVILNLSGDTYPPWPVMKDFDALQALNGAEALTVSWYPFEGGGATDFIQLELRPDRPGAQTVFRTPAPEEPGALDGTATSVTIPAGVLQPAQAYVGRLLFRRILGIHFDYGPETPAVTGYFRETEFSLHATRPDPDPPLLVEFSPAAGNAAVPRHSGVAFVFSEPMGARQSVTWTGIDPGSITYRWTDDGRILYALPIIPLPPDAEIGWRIHPAGFADLAGNSLLGENHFHRFHTDAAEPAGVGDLGLIGFRRTEHFEQDPGGIPTRTATGGYTAAVSVDSTGFNTLLEGTVETPDGRFLPLPYTRGNALRREDGFDTPEALSEAAPSGIYRITVDTAHDGIRTATVAVPDAGFPTMPEIVNLESLDGLDPTTTWEIRWKPFEGSRAGDAIRVRVYYEGPFGDSVEVFGTPESTAPGSLDGTRTSVVIPAGTLVPNYPHRIELEFIRTAVDDSTVLPGTRVVVTEVRVTNARFFTAAPPVDRVAISRTGTGRIRLAFLPPALEAWVLERSSDPAGPWTFVSDVFSNGFGDPWIQEETPSGDTGYFRTRKVAEW